MAASASPDDTNLIHYLDEITLHRGEKGKEVVMTVMIGE